MASIELADIYVDGVNASARARGLKDLVLGRGNRSGAVRIPILKGVSFAIRDGERVGIIGNNGAGKSSLLRCIAGIYPPRHGTVRVAGRVAPLIEMGVGLNHNLSGRQNIRLGLIYSNRLGEYSPELERQIIEFTELGEKIDIPFKYYSSGMSARLAFSIAIFQHPDILLLDEVFAVGDQHFVAKAQAAMKQKFTSVPISVLVSHNEANIRDLCTRCIWMEQGVVKMDGPTHEVLDIYYANSPARAKPAAAAK